MEHVVQLQVLEYEEQLKAEINAQLKGFHSFGTQVAVEVRGAEIVHKKGLYTACVNITPNKTGNARNITQLLGNPVTTSTAQYGLNNC
jgi:hypothetical protein